MGREVFRTEETAKIRKGLLSEDALYSPLRGNCGTNHNEMYGQMFRYEPCGDYDGWRKVEGMTVLF